MSLIKYHVGNIRRRYYVNHFLFLRIDFSCFTGSLCTSIIRVPVEKKPNTVNNRT